MKAQKFLRGDVVRVKTEASHGMGTGNIGVIAGSHLQRYPAFRSGLAKVYEDDAKIDYAICFHNHGEHSWYDEDDLVLVTSIAEDVVLTDMLRDYEPFELINMEFEHIADAILEVLGWI